MLLAKAGRDNPVINRSIDRYVARAKEVDARVELVVQPTGPHGFETTKDADPRGHAPDARLPQGAPRSRCGRQLSSGSAWRWRAAAATSQAAPTPLQREITGLVTEMAISIPTSTTRCR